MSARFVRPAGTLVLLSYVFALAAAAVWWTTTTWPIQELMQPSAPPWIRPLLLAEVMQFVVVVGGFLLISRLSARQIGLRWDAVPRALIGGLLVWVLAQVIALGPTRAVAAVTSSTPLLLKVPQAPGLLLAYAAVGVLEETEFRGILLGQLVARLRGSTGAGMASVLALLGSTTFFVLLHVPSFASNGWTDLRILPTVLQDVTVMGLALGLCYLLTGNLVFAMVVHTLFDSAELVLLGRVDGPSAHPFVTAGLIVALAWGAPRVLNTRRELEDPRSEREELGLGGLFVWLAIFGGGLAGLEQLAGWPAQPTPPDHWPSWVSIEVWLNSPLAGLGILVPLALDVGWLVWALTAASIVLQALVDLLDAATRGAAWVRSIRLATNWLVLPPIRRAVDASLSGLLFARVLVQPASAVDASSAPTASIVMLAPADAQPTAARLMVDGIRAASARVETPAPVEESEVSPGAVELVYTVQPGDTLWAIGGRFYADPQRGAELIFQTNQGRRQADGRVFDRRGLIFPGWTLRIVDPARGIEHAADGSWWYTVQPGDTISGICARLLGDPALAGEVFELNRGAQAPDGHVLVNPDVIWPGLRLRIWSYMPSVATSVPEPVAEEPAPEAAATPSPVAPSAIGQAADRQDRSSSPAPAPTASAPPASAAAEMPQPPLSETPVPTAVPPSPPPRQVQPGAGGTVSPEVAALGAAGLATAAVVASQLVVRRRRPAPIPTEPESNVRIDNGFAEYDPVEDLARRLARTSDPAAAIASLLGQAYAAIFDEQLQPDERQACSGVTVAATRHGRTSTTLVLAAPVAARSHLALNMRAAAERAFGQQVDVDGLVGQDGDVLVRVTWDPRRPIAGHVLERVNAENAPSAWPAPCLIRSMVLRDRQQLSINWHGLHNVLVAAPTGQGADVPLIALVASLASVRAAEDLGLVVVARPRTLPEEVGVFPHGLLDVVDPGSPDTLRQALESVKEEVDRRREADSRNDADLVVVVRELGDMEPDAMQILGAIAASGPRYGVRLLSASERPVAELLRICPFFDHFGTRLVLQTASEEDSVALLGMPGAEYLGAGGLGLLRLEGRVPVQGWTRQVSADRLSRLVHMMGTRSPTVATRGDDEPVPAAAEPVEGNDTQRSEPETQSVSDGVNTREQPAATRRDWELLDKLRAAPIRVRCFGAGEAWYGDRLLDITDRELLLLLAVHPVTGIQSEALADMLWDHCPTDIGASLRKERFQLRTDLRRLAPQVTAEPLPAKQTHSGKVVSLEPSVVSSDVHEFTELLDLAEKAEKKEHNSAAAIELYEAALSLYRGDLLDSTNIPSYRWMYDEDPQIALTLRSDLRRRHKETRLHLAELLTQGPEAGLTRAEELYSGLCAEEPENEHLWTALFRIHERTGSTLGLQSAVHRLRGALAELGTDGVADVDSTPLPKNLERIVQSIRSRIDSIAAPPGS